MAIETEDFRQAVKEYMNIYRGYDKATSALEELADELGVQVEPRSFSIEGYAFNASDLEHKDVGLYKNPDGGHSHIKLRNKFEDTFGVSGWARKKYRLTVEEILEDE